MTYESEKFDVAAAIERDFGIGGNNRKVVKLPVVPEQKHEWEKPKSLSSEILPAPELPIKDIPSVISDYAIDIAYRMQCPVDFVVIPMLVSVAGAIGKNVRMRPKKKDNWGERPCLWGGVIAEKSSMKSPAISEAIKPFAALEGKLAEMNDIAMKDWEHAASLAKMRENIYKKDIEKILRKDRTAAVCERPEDCDPPEKPEKRRLITTDATIEKLAEMMRGQNSITLVRDELSGFMKNMSRYNSGSDRQFYLESYSGGEHSEDRIGRGSIFVKDVYLNIVGGIQPDVAKICFSKETGDDDGFFERFGLMVYPEKKRKWENIDEYPDYDAMNAYSEMLENIVFSDWKDFLTAEKRDEEKFFVRFNDEAQSIFYDWYENHMRKHDKEGQETKMRGLVARLALVFHVAENVMNQDESISAVSADTILASLNFCENYLLPHWKRINSAFTDSEDESDARKILEWLKKEGLETFGLYDVRRKFRTDFKDKDKALEALAVLCDCDYIAEKPPKPGKVGRKKISYIVNPLINNQ